jgi:glycosyltransferase involved in cell wall biosynthesis
MECSSMFAAESRVRVLALGPARGPASAACGEPPASWTEEEVRDGSQAAGRELLLRIRREGCDVLHLADARLAPLGRELGERLGVPVTVDVGPGDLVTRGPGADRMFAAIDDLDAAFVFGRGGEDSVRLRTRRVGIARLPLVAVAPGEPAAAPLDALTRVLAGVEAGRPVAAVPWTEDGAAWRWFCDGVLGARDHGAVWLVVGAPGGALVELPAEARADTVLVHRSPLNDGAVAALARCVDAFVVPWTLGEGAPETDALLRLALAASGVPVIATDDGGRVFDHERNAFIVRAADAVGFRATLDQLFGLPARQRHYIGEEFAEDAQARWPASAASAVYDDWFSALGGRPNIPAELRIA